MTKRILRCECNYELRFGASTCPYCFRATPYRNRLWFWVLLLLVAGGMLALTIYDGAVLLTG